jgi:hypothetical protein
MRPAEDVPTCLVMTFLGERTPVVDRTGLSVRERMMTPALSPWAALSAEPGDTRPRGEAGRPPLAGRRRLRKGGDLQGSKGPDAAR